MPHADPEDVGMSSARLARIGPAMQAFVDKGVFAGINTIVARKGAVVQSGSYGFSDRDTKAPMAADAIFRLYSMTKPIVSTALMMLYEEGLIRLIDPVARYIPAFAKLKVLQADGTLARCQRPMNVQDLLTHMSGLTYNFLEDSPVSDMYVDGKLADPSVSLADSIEDLARLPLAFQPGTRWHYSVGIDVAARLIELVSGTTLADFLDQRLFAPLGMIDTAYHVPAAKRARLAKMYGRPDIISAKGSANFKLWMQGYNEAIDVSATYPVDAPETFQRGGHGLFGTAADYLRFAQMLC